MIIGAGLAGLIGAHTLPGEIHEAAEAPAGMHKALLRFRTQDVSRVTGIEFRPVTVRKGIWWNGFVGASIRTANFYSGKCLGGHLVGERSIWNLEPVTRYIAPSDFYSRLVEKLHHRICWASPFDFGMSALMDEPVVNTAPLDVVLRRLRIHSDEPFTKASIFVERWKVSDCDLHQTIYFPSPYTPVYRASITGDVLIIEAVEAFREDQLKEVIEAFGLCGTERISKLDNGHQRYGKIAPIDEIARKHYVAMLTTNHNIFSLGRFATWRNLLLDDVVNDAQVVKKLLTASAYERKLHPHI